MADITWAVVNGEVEAGTTKYCSVCELDTNKFVAVFMDDDDADTAKARVGTVVGSTITWGNAVPFCVGIQKAGFSLGVTKLDTDKFVVVYAKTTNHLGYVRLANVAVRTITFEAEVACSGANHLENPSICTLSTSKFAVIYNDETGGDVGTCLICSVAADVITPDTVNALAFESRLGVQNSCEKLDTDKLMAFYVDMGDGSKAKACAFDVVGTTPTAGPILQVDAQTNTSVGITAIDTDKCAIIWSESAGDDSAKATIIYRDDVGAPDSLHVGAVVVINVNSASVNIAKISATHLVCVFRDNDDGSVGKSRYCSYAVTTITVDGEETWSGVNWIDSLDVWLISANKVILFYGDGTDGGKGKVLVGGMGPGWLGKISGVTNPAKVMGVDKADIAEVKGVA